MTPGPDGLDLQRRIAAVFRFPRAGAPDLIVSVDPGPPTSLRLSLIFREGREYCCAEPGCHLGLFPQSRWDAIIDAVRQSGIEVGIEDRVLVHGTIEADAVFTYGGKMRLRDSTRSEYSHLYLRPLPTTR